MPVLRDLAQPFQIRTDSLAHEQRDLADVGIRHILRTVDEPVRDALNVHRVPDPPPVIDHVRRVRTRHEHLAFSVGHLQKRVRHAQPLGPRHHAVRSQFPAVKDRGSVLADEVDVVRDRREHLPQALVGPPARRTENDARLRQLADRVKDLLRDLRLAVADQRAVEIGEDDLRNPHDFCAPVPFRAVHAAVHTA